MHPLQGTGREGQRAALAILGAVVVADQAAKLLVAQRLPLGTSVQVIPGLLAFTHVHNRGIAFSLLGDVSVAVPAALAALLLGLLVFPGRWSRRPAVRGALALLGGGAVGNLIDRLRVGAVVDFIDLRVWPVFNLADVAVTAGAGLLLLHLLRGER